MSTPIQIGPYADPPVSDRWFVRIDGQQFERTEQMLKAGGRHRIDINCKTSEVREVFIVPRGDGRFEWIYVNPAEAFLR